MVTTFCTGGSDGKIVVAGSMEVSGDRDWLVARFSAAGALDNTFSSNGWVTTDLLGYDDEVHALVIQADGKILVGGSAGINGSGNHGFGLARYTSAGALDTTYSTDGIVTDNNWGSAFYDLAIQSDGKAVAAGYAPATGGGSNLSVRRFTTSGGTDRDFGGGGVIVIQVPVVVAGMASGVSIDSAGRVNVAGTTASGDAVLTRQLSTGALDSSFASDGIAYVDLGSSADAVHELVLMGDGSLLAVGETDNGTETDIALVRVHGDANDGTLYALHDANFNVTSIVAEDGTGGGREVIERYLFDAYGERSVLNADWTVDTDGLSDVEWVHGHQGGRHDLGVGLVHFRFRDLDTSLGRWEKQDPMGYHDGMSLYTYAKGNAQYYRDPTGLYVNPDMIGDPEAMLSQYWEWLQERTPWYQAWLPDSSIAGGFGGANGTWYQMGAMSLAFYPGKKDDGSNMWVYTCKCGWIDLGHFTAAASYSAYLMRPFHQSPPWLKSAASWAISRLVYAGSIAVEIHQMIAKLAGDTSGWGSSAWTYEDLPSNWQGALFGANLPASGRADELLAQYLKDCGAVDPSAGGGALIQDAIDMQVAVNYGGRGFGVPPGGPDPYALSSTPVRTPSHDKVCNCDGTPK